ncbi:MAG TPA: PLD nuclease N-terminal domain-containing protein [Bacillota bacterium]|nr:PLD nuclease N-terminal domain-containing protein [Bacillota bacterium]
MKLHYGVDELSEFDFAAFLPVILPMAAIGLILVVTALIDLYRHRERRENVLIWALIIIFANTIGSILYFVIGRKDSGGKWS